MADTCLDEFTDHGHCGVLDGAAGSIMTPPDASMSNWLWRKRIRAHTWSARAA